VAALLPLAALLPPSLAVLQGLALPLLLPVALALRLLALEGPPLLLPLGCATVPLALGEAERLALRLGEDVERAAPGPPAEAEPGSRVVPLGGLLALAQRLLLPEPLLRLLLLALPELLAQTVLEELPPAARGDTACTAGSTPSSRAASAPPW